MLYFNPETLHQLLMALWEIKLRGPVNKSGGICMNVSILLEVEPAPPPEEENTDHTIRRLLTQLFKEWPDGTGNSFNPVPGYTIFGKRQDHKAHRCFNLFGRWSLMWVKWHPYGRARWRLLDWLIQQVEAELMFAQFTELKAGGSLS